MATTSASVRHTIPWHQFGDVPILFMHGLPWMHHGTIIKHLADTGNLNVDTQVCFLLLVHHSENHSFLFKDIRSHTRSRVSPLTEHCSWRPLWCKWLDWQVGRLLNWLFIIIRPIFSSMKLGMLSLLILGWLSSSMQQQIHHIAVVLQDGWYWNLVILNHLISHQTPASNVYAFACACL